MRFVNQSEVYGCGHIYDVDVQGDRKGNNVIGLFRSVRKPRYDRFSFKRGGVYLVCNVTFLLWGGQSSKIPISVYNPQRAGGDI